MSNLNPIAPRSMPAHSRVQPSGFDAPDNTPIRAATTARPSTAWASALPQTRSPRTGRTSVRPAFTFSSPVTKPLRIKRAIMTKPYRSPDGLTCADLHAKALLSMTEAHNG